MHVGCASDRTSCPGSDIPVVESDLTVRKAKKTRQNKTTTKTLLKSEALTTNCFWIHDCGWIRKARALNRP